MDIQTHDHDAFCAFVPVLAFHYCCVVLAEFKEKKQQGKQTSCCR